MSILKKGITGFNTEATITEKQVKTFLNRITYPFDVDYNNIQAPNTSSNYWRVPYFDSSENEHFDLLINSTLWYLAIVSKKSSWMNLDFLNFSPDMYHQIRSIGGPEMLMQKQILDRDIEPQDLEELDKSEIEQITYWKSRTIGEVMFNGYD